MKENAGFVITFTLMMVTIMVLHGCTRLDKMDSQARSWDVELVSYPDGECRAIVRANHRDSQEDDTMSIENTLGAGT